MEIHWGVIVSWLYVSLIVEVKLENALLYASVAVFAKWSL